MCRIWGSGGQEESLPNNLPLTHRVARRDTAESRHDAAHRADPPFHRIGKFTRIKLARICLGSDLASSFLAQTFIRFELCCLHELFMFQPHWLLAAQTHRSFAHDPRESVDLLGRTPRAVAEAAAARQIMRLTHRHFKYFV